MILDLFGAAVVVAVTLSLCVKDRTRLIGLLLGTPVIGLLLLRNVVPVNLVWPFIIATRISMALFLAFAILVLVMTLLRQAPASHDGIVGAFCGYLLIGVMFAEIYCLIETADHNSFKIEAPRVLWKDESLHNWLTLEYFSFMTLTTVGYGDVVPLTPTVRFIAAWEAICGQFYMAVLVAGLVNLRATDVADELEPRSEKT